MTAACITSPTDTILSLLQSPPSSSLPPVALSRAPMCVTRSFGWSDFPIIGNGADNPASTTPRKNIDLSPLPASTTVRRRLPSSTSSCQWSLYTSSIRNGSACPSDFLSHCLFDLASAASALSPDTNTTVAVATADAPMRLASPYKKIDASPKEESSSFTTNPHHHHHHKKRVTVSFSPGFI